MDKPFHIDIGSHNGFYLFGLATLFPNTNFIGLEIQNRQVEKCLKKRQRLKEQSNEFYANNVHFINANIISKNGSFQHFLGEFSKRHATVQSISILNPDPCFKRRQIKRRMINENVLNYLINGLEKNTLVYIQSDNEMTFDHIRSIFFSPRGVENFTSVDSQNILNCKPKWYHDNGNNNIGISTLRHDIQSPHYPSFTKGDGINDCIEIPVGENDERHFLGIAP
eukprot:g3662.t1